MLVYDITHQESFDNITNWIENVEEVSTMVVILHVVVLCVGVYRVGKVTLEK